MLIIFQMKHYDEKGYIFTYTAMQLVKLKKGHVSIPYYLTLNFFAYDETVIIIIIFNSSAVYVRSLVPNHSIRNT